MGSGDVRTCLGHQWELGKVSEQWKGMFPAGLQGINLADNMRNLADLAPAHLSSHASPMASLQPPSLRP